MMACVDELRTRLGALVADKPDLTAASCAG